MKVSFNRKFVKKLSKDKFIKTFKSVYPKIDLSKEYDKIVPPAKKEDK